MFFNKLALPVGIHGFPGLVFLTNGLEHFRLSLGSRVSSFGIDWRRVRFARGLSRIHHRVQLLPELLCQSLPPSRLQVPRLSVVGRWSLP